MERKKEDNPVSVTHRVNGNVPVPATLCRFVFRRIINKKVDNGFLRLIYRSRDCVA